MQEIYDRQKINRQIREAAPVLGVVVLFYALLQLLGITCPIKYVTGISCAGCGMTRAWLHLMTGDFSGAFAYHPLVLLPLPMLFLILFRHRLRPALYKCLLFIGIGLFIIVYLIRMFDPADTIVVFEPRNGVFFRTVKSILTLLGR